ncbi:MAG: 5-oxoprolinase subunit PxpB [Bacillota bacterium]
MIKPSFKPAGDSALAVEWEAPVTPELNNYIAGLRRELEQRLAGGVIETIPAYQTLLVCYDPEVIDYSSLVSEIGRLLPGGRQATRIHRNKTVRIPVFYGGQYGPDLAQIAAEKQITPDDVVKIHSGAVYRVYAIGFLPGFPYLGFVDKSIATPRKRRPRAVVPAGSVGIAGTQTGIYSLTSPGGWQIIGRTPVKLFKVESNEFLLSVGDQVIFQSVGDDIGYGDINPEAWGDLYREG